jgi:hypothetical protein
MVESYHRRKGALARVMVAAPSTMQDLRVLFTDAGDGSYRAQLADAQGRRLGVEVPFAPFLTESDYEDLRWSLEEYMDLPDGGAVVRAQRIERELERWGRELYDALFTVIAQGQLSPIPDGLPAELRKWLEEGRYTEPRPVRSREQSARSSPGSRGPSGRMERRGSASRGIGLRPQPRTGFYRPVGPDSGQKRHGDGWRRVGTSPLSPLPGVRARGLGRPQAGEVGGEGRAPRLKRASQKSAPPSRRRMFSPG